MLTDPGEYRAWLKTLALAQIPVDLRGRIDPSDIVQQTICEAISDLPKYRGKTRPEFMGWLRSMLRFHLIDSFRALKFSPRASIDASLGLTDDGMSRLLQANISSVGHRVIKEEQAMELAKLLQQLWFIEGLGGLTYSHICECYPINENLVWCRVSSRCLRCS